MERQSTSKLFRFVIALFAFFVICSSSILFASCGKTLSDGHEHEYEAVPNLSKEATCGENGFNVYECKLCHEQVKIDITLATGQHTMGSDGRCTKCGKTEAETDALTQASFTKSLTDLQTLINTLAKSDQLSSLSTELQAVSNAITSANVAENIPQMQSGIEDILEALGIAPSSVAGPSAAPVEGGLIQKIEALGTDLDSVLSKLEEQATTLGTISSALTTLTSKVDALGGKVDGLTTLLGGSHVHHWVEDYENATGDCLTGLTYGFKCAVCGVAETYPAGIEGHTQGDKVTVTQKPGHILEYKTNLSVEDKHTEPTCVDPGYVQGHCVICGADAELQPYGKPTYQHNYVLEDGTNAGGSKPTEGGHLAPDSKTCTSIHTNVYHCATCGGAYTEEVTSENLDPDLFHGNASTPHNYYSKLNDEGKPTGEPLTDEDKLAAFNEYAGKSEEDAWTDIADAKAALNTQQQYEALEKYLNVVFEGTRSCVDPILIVVECTECGVRYSYSHGDALGHKFVQLGQKADCTMYGIQTYYYCEHCHYYFDFGDGVKPKDIFLEDAEGNVTTTTNPESLYFYSRNYYAHDGYIFNGEDERHAVEDALGYEPFLGHDYVVVYTNAETCTTAQDYVLVCKRCYKEGDVDFAGLVKNGTFTEVTAGKVYTVTDKTAEHKFTATTNDAESSLVYEWTNLWNADKSSFAEGVTAETVAKWLETYHYLTRDERDEQITAADLAEATVAELKALFSDTNMVESLEIPVKGHTFNEFVVTVADSCVTYERTVYFCTACGGQIVNPGLPRPEKDENGKWSDIPYIVAPDSDDYAFTSSLHPQGDNDLKTAWNKVSGTDATVDGLVKWLGDYGYLNAFRTSLTEDVDVEELKTALKAYLGKDLTVDLLKPFFTAENATFEYIKVKELGHTFDTALVKSADCESEGMYVYVCVKCGAEKAPTDTLKYVVGKNPTVDTQIPEVQESAFTAMTDKELYEKSVPEERRGETYDETYGEEVTDLFAAPWATLAEDGLEGDVTDVMFNWLYKHGYLNGIKDMLRGVGAETQSLLNKSYGEWEAKGADAQKEAVKTKLFELLEESKGSVSLWSLFTSSNQASDFLGVEIPVMQHKWSISDTDPHCESFADKTLTQFYKEHYTAKWNADKKVWEKGEHIEDELWAKLDPTFKANADKYGVVAACTRDNCPQRKATYEVKEGTPYTAGYVAATPHQLVYFKYAALEDGTPDPDDKNFIKDSETGLRVEYNMFEVEDYENAEDAAKYLDGGKAWEDASEVEKHNAAYAAMANDEHNLKVLDAIYKTVAGETEGTYEKLYAVNGGTLDPEEVMPAAEKWKPLTKVNTPSCWLSLRCRWYHWEGPKWGVEETWDGSICTKREADTPHTLPQPGDPDFDTNAANCQHGDRCTVCGHIMNTNVGHHLADITELQKNPASMEKYGDALAKLIETEDWYVAPLDATCCETGIKVEVCTGELEIYLTEDGEVNPDVKWVEGINYKVSTTDKLAHDYSITTYYKLNGDVIGDKAAFDKYMEDPRNICLTGYYKIDTCGLTDRNGEPCNCKDGHIRIDDDTDEYGRYDWTEAPEHTFAPVENYWESLGRYRAPTEDHVAWVSHICVVCGEAYQGYYGENTREDGSKQYQIATPEQIEEYNATNPEIRAQEIRLEDTQPAHDVEGTDGFMSGNALKNGHYALPAVTEEDGPQDYSIDGSAGRYVVGGSYVGSTTVVDLNGNNLAIDKEGTGAGFLVKGTVQFMNGDLEIGGKGIVWDNYGGMLSLKNVNLTLSGDDGRIVMNGIRGGKIVIENSVIRSTNRCALETTNAAGAKDAVYVLKDSTFIGNTVGLLWNNNQGTSSLTAEGCTFYGKQAGAVVRGGTASFTECAFYSDGTTPAGSWGEYTAIGAAANIVIGSQTTGYGDVDATLTDCMFGTTTLKDGGTGTDLFNEIGASYGTQKRLALYAATDLTTKVTLDGTLFDSVKDSKDGDGVLLNVIIKGTAEEVVASVKSAIATGGIINLPEEVVTLDEVVSISGDVTLMIPTSLTVKGLSVSAGGSLSVVGGDLIVNDKTSEKSNVAVLVEGSLDLKDVNLTVSAAVYAIYAKGTAKVTIANSLVHSTKGIVLSTNNLYSTNVTFVLLDSAFIADFVDTDNGSFAVLLNNANSKLYAGGCTFYGHNGAAWIRSGKAVFYGCTFAATNTTADPEKNTWGAGTKTAVLAALVIGNGGSTSYGNADVTLTDCGVKFYTHTPAAESKLSVSSAETEGTHAYDEEGGVKWVEEGSSLTWTVSATETTGTALYLALYGSDTVKVTFSDKVTAQNFLGKDIKITKGTNLFVADGASTEQLTAAYMDGSRSISITPDPAE